MKDAVKDVYSCRARGKAWYGGLQEIRVMNWTEERSPKTLMTDDCQEIASRCRDLI